MTTTGERVEPGIDRVLELVSEALNISIDESQAGEPLSMMGLDSLGSVELQEAIEQTFGVRIPIGRFTTDLTVHQILMHITEISTPQDNSVSASRAASTVPTGDVPQWTLTSHVKYPTEAGDEFRFPTGDWWAPDDEALATIESARERFPNTIAAMEECAQRGDQPGAQIHISQAGKSLLSISVGMAEADRKMQNNYLIPWLCAGKPLYSIAFGQLWERNLVDLDMPVADVLPEFGKYGKDRIKFVHLLTHSTGLKPDPVYPCWDMGEDEVLSAIYAAELPADVTPGLTAYYSGFWAWFILAKVIEKLDGREVKNYIREEIFEPLELEATRLWMDEQEFHEIRDRIAPLWQLPIYKRAFPMLSKQKDFARRLPGVIGLGSAENIARIYQALMPRSYNGPAVLKPTTAEAIIAPRRVALYDAHYASHVTHGLGFVSEGWHFGQYCSPRTFGQQGNFTNFIVADPTHDLVIAVLPNGMRKTSRDRTVINAVYTDLGIVDQSSATPRIMQTLPEQDPNWLRMAEDEHYFWGAPDARE